MADCGATGSALDQAATAVLGGANASAQVQKQLGAVLGHASIAGLPLQSAVASPVQAARPDHVVFPGGHDTSLGVMQGPMGVPMHQQKKATMIQSPMDAVWQNSKNHPQISRPLTTGHYQPAQIHLAMQHQQLMMMQQQQFLQQQQQNMMMQRAQQQALDQQCKALEVAQTENVDAGTLILEQAHQQTEEWHEGLVEEAVAENLGNIDAEGLAKGASIEELASAWAEAQADLEQLDADEVAKGASIEELAAAWAEAQADYYNDLDTVVDPSSWWEGNEETDREATAYEFINRVDDNTRNNHAESNFMEEGMKNFKEGNLALAIENFEMELQVHDLDNSTAWRMLGRCHAENDMDRQAIVCLEQAVDRDPYSPEALLALGVSYVNELNHTKALANLKSWITNNPEYAGMDLDMGEDFYGASESGPTQDSQSGFHEVQSLLLKALEYESADAADVWEALGVAANVSRDYETAVEAFYKAIDERPDDYQLWNKLGATLANSNQSDKALPAYHKALQLKPKYARAWLNMAISHSNLQDYEEAARCYLQTLSLNPAAVHCWSYLRVALSCSERWDLIPAVASQDLLAFKEHFDFVIYPKRS